METGLTPDDVAPVVRFAVLRTARKLRLGRSRSALSNNKIAILGHLAREGASTPSRIGEEERQHPQSLTRPLAELETAGLIVRAPDADDGRRSILRLTEKGRAAFDADMRLRDRWLRSALSACTADELQLLADAARLLERLEADQERDDR